MYTQINAPTNRSSSGQGASVEGEFTMQQVVAMTGVGEHALRFYERMSLLAPVHRQSSSGHRRYSMVNVSTIEMLACLRAAGMPLAQMRQYLELAPKRADGAADALRILAEQRIALEAQVQTLQERLAYVEQKVAFWQAVAAHDQPAVDEFGRRFAARVRGAAQGHVAPDQSKEPAAHSEITQRWQIIGAFQVLRGSFITFFPDDRRS